MFPKGSKKTPIKKYRGYTNISHWKRCHARLKRKSISQDYLVKKKHRKVLNTPQHTLWVRRRPLSLNWTNLMAHQNTIRTIMNKHWTINNGHLKASFKLQVVSLRLASPWSSKHRIAGLLLKRFKTGNQTSMQQRTLSAGLRRSDYREASDLTAVSSVYTIGIKKTRRLMLIRPW